MAYVCKKHKSKWYFILLSRERRWLYMGVRPHIYALDEDIHSAYARLARAEQLPAIWVLYPVVLKSSFGHWSHQEFVKN